MKDINNESAQVREQRDHQWSKEIESLNFVNQWKKYHKGIDRMPKLEMKELQEVA